MVTYISRSPEETVALGERWGCDATPGWLIGLRGDLGTGKTQLVKGIARGLGFMGRVRSPSFALVHEYAGGRLPLVHIDLYRLETAAQVGAAGLEPYFERPAGVVVVEWIDRWLGEARTWASAGWGGGISFREVWLESLGDLERRIVYEDTRA